MLLCNPRDREAARRRGPGQRLDAGRWGGRGRPEAPGRAGRGV